MKRICILGLLIVLQIIYTKLAKAQLNFTAAIKTHSVALFADLIQRNTYYYLAGDLEIRKSTDGRPDFNFIVQAEVYTLFPQIKIAVDTATINPFSVMLPSNLKLAKDHNNDETTSQNIIVTINWQKKENKIPFLVYGYHQDTTK